MNGTCYLNENLFYAENLPTIISERYYLFNRVDLHIKKLRYNEGIFAFTSSELEVLSFVA